MLDGWRVLRRATRLFYQEMFYLVAANLVWTLCAFFIAPIPLTTAALFYVANRVARYEGIVWQRIWPAVRTHWKTLYFLGGINLVFYGVWIYDLLFYADAPGILGIVLQSVPLALLFFWTLIQFNILPVLFERNQVRLDVVLLEAVCLIFERPGVYLTVSMFLLSAIAVGLWLPFVWMIVALSYLAVVFNVALLDQRGFYKVFDEQQAQSERKQRRRGKNRG